MKVKELKFLDKINSTADLKKLDVRDLPLLAEDIRQFILHTVSRTGGHLAPSLGTVELTIAMHYFFNSPKDKIIWDVGHQAYTHKILTGRKDRFHTLRQYKGLSGFPKIAESEHDVYGTGHASTSISAGLGFAAARDLKNEDYEVVTVIGDGALTGGNALEALNQAGYLNTRGIIILNDNRMSISKNVGAISQYTHRIEKTQTYQQVKDSINTIIQQAGGMQADGLKDKLARLKTNIKKVGTAGLLFEKLGLNYFGPVDGHNIEELLETFTKAVKVDGLKLIHVRTTKGKGYSYAENDKPRYHGVSPFDIESGENLKNSDRPTFTRIFADTLVEMAEADESIVGITAAMPDGTGMIKFIERFPRRSFDVGIAEQHAVVFAAGLARQGLKPVTAIYSSFLQRAYDAIIHDVCLQELPVTFALDRAGLVGSDGPTHHGCFDLSYLRHIPNLVVLAPKNGADLRDMLFTAVYSGKPAAIRYPRGYCPDNSVEKRPFRTLEMGTCEVEKEGDELTVVSVGSVFPIALKAAEVLEEQGVGITLIDARFVKPMDETIVGYIRRTRRAVIVEENALMGGFGSSVLELCNVRNVTADIKCIGIPDRFIEHGEQDQLRQICGIDSESIVNAALMLLK